MVQDRTYIPRSCRAPEFQVNFSDHAKSNLPENINNLEPRIQALKSAYEEAARGVILDTLSIELDSFMTEDKKLVATLLHAIAKSTTSHDGHQFDTNQKVADLITKSPDILRYTSFYINSNTTEFFEFYKQQFSLDAMPPPPPPQQTSHAPTNDDDACNEDLL